VFTRTFSIRWRRSIAGYEASADITTFTSKFDAVLAGKAQFTPQEQMGYDTVSRKAHSNAATEIAGPVKTPLFTDFTASNIGTPANSLLSHPILLRSSRRSPATSLIRQGLSHRRRRRAFLTRDPLPSDPSR